MSDIVIVIKKKWAMVIASFLGLFFLSFITYEGLFSTTPEHSSKKEGLKKKFETD